MNELLMTMEHGSKHDMGETEVVAEKPVAVLLCPP